MAQPRNVEVFEEDRCVVKLHPTQDLVLVAGGEGIRQGSIKDVSDEKTSPDSIDFEEPMITTTCGFEDFLTDICLCHKPNSYYVGSCQDGQAIIFTNDGSHSLPICEFVSPCVNVDINLIDYILVASEEGIIKVQEISIDNVTNEIKCTNNSIEFNGDKNGVICSKFIRNDIIGVCGCNGRFSIWKIENMMEKNNNQDSGNKLSLNSKLIGENGKLLTIIKGHDIALGYQRLVFDCVLSYFLLPSKNNICIVSYDTIVIDKKYCPILQTFDNLHENDICYVKTVTDSTFECYFMAVGDIKGYVSIWQLNVNKENNNNNNVFDIVNVLGSKQYSSNGSSVGSIELIIRSKSDENNNNNNNNNGDNNTSKLELFVTDCNGKLFYDKIIVSPNENKNKMKAKKIENELKNKNNSVNKQKTPVSKNKDENVEKSKVAAPASQSKSKKEDKCIDAEKNESQSPMKARNTEKKKEKEKVENVNVSNNDKRDNKEEKREERREAGMPIEIKKEANVGKAKLGKSNSEEEDDDSDFDIDIDDGIDNIKLDINDDDDDDDDDDNDNNSNKNTIKNKSGKKIINSVKRRIIKKSRLEENDSDIDSDNENRNETGKDDNSNISSVATSPEKQEKEKEKERKMEQENENRKEKEMAKSGLSFDDDGIPTIDVTGNNENDNNNDNDNDDSDKDKSLSLDTSVKSKENGKFGMRKFEMKEALAAENEEEEEDDDDIDMNMKNEKKKDKMSQGKHNKDKIVDDMDDIDDLQNNLDDDDDDLDDGFIVNDKKTMGNEDDIDDINDLDTLSVTRDGMQMAGAAAGLAGVGMHNMMPVAIHLPFQINKSPFDDNGQRYLTWNEIGAVICRRQATDNNDALLKALNGGAENDNSMAPTNTTTNNLEFHYSYEIDFCDKSIYSRAIRFTDLKNFEMAALSGNGLLLACNIDNDKNNAVNTKSDSFDLFDINENSNEEQKQQQQSGNSNKKVEYSSVISYRPFSSWGYTSSNRIGWEYNLTNGEKCVCIGLTPHYIIVGTNKGYLRVFTNSGLQCNIISLTGQAICIVGNIKQPNDIVSIVTCNNNSNELNMMVVDLNNNEMIYNGNIALTPFCYPNPSQLKWIYISSKGKQIFTIDSENMLRVLTNNKQFGGIVNNNSNSGNGNDSNNNNNKVWMPILDISNYINENGNGTSADGNSSIEMNLTTDAMIHVENVEHMDSIPLFVEFNEINHTLQLTCILMPIYEHRHRSTTITRRKDIKQALDYSVDVLKCANISTIAIEIPMLKHSNIHLGNEFINSEESIIKNSLLYNIGANNNHSATDMHYHMKEEIKNYIKLFQKACEMKQIVLAYDIATIYLKHSLKGTNSCLKIAMHLKLPDLAEKLNKYLSKASARPYGHSTYNNMSNAAGTGGIATSSSLARQFVSRNQTRGNNSNSNSNSNNNTHQSRIAGGSILSAASSSTSTDNKNIVGNTVAGKKRTSRVAGLDKTSFGSGVAASVNSNENQQSRANFASHKSSATRIGPPPAKKRANPFSKAKV